MTWQTRAAGWIATGFGVGHLPWAPGTWGSLAALPFAWLIAAAAGPVALAAAAAIALAAGIWAAGEHARATGRHDHGSIVIDEIMGQWLTLSVAPLDPLLYGLGFALFRAADILKPWPVGWLDRRLGGGEGIMLDDLVAAIYAGAGLVLLRELLGR